MLVEDGSWRGQLYRQRDRGHDGKGKQQTEEGRPEVQPSLHPTSHECRDWRNRVSDQQRQLTRSDGRKRQFQRYGPDGDDFSQI